MMMAGQATRSPLWMSIRCETCGRGRFALKTAEMVKHRPNSPFYYGTIGQLAGMCMKMLPTWL